MKIKYDSYSASKDFFRKNERSQNLLIMRIAYFTPLAGLAMLAGALSGIFVNATPKTYIILTAVLMVQSVLMKIFCTINPEHPAIKYFMIITTELIVFFLTITKGFSPFIIYVVAPLLSCIYFNRKFCFFTSTMSYIAMIISIIMRAQPEYPLNEGISSLQWGIEYGIGLSLEYMMNIGLLYLMSIRHLDVLNTNLFAIETFERTQDELIAGYSELVYRAHQSRNVNVKRCQCVVSMLCRILSHHSGYSELKDDECVNAIVSAVPLHDLGLIGVSDRIVSKASSYTESEKMEYQKHVIYGDELIRKNFYLSENREFLKIARLAAMYHHEQWDGSGYPEGLIGTEIPLCARIIAVADELEMRVSGDNVHPPVSFETALSQVQKLAGYVLDPVIVEALTSSRMSLEEIYSSPEEGDQIQ